MEGKEPVSNLGDAIGRIVDPIKGIALDLPTRRRRRAPAQTEGPAKSSSMPNDKQILLIIGGGIAAYKSLDLIRRLRERGVRVRCVMSKAAQEFVTPLSVGAIAGEQAFTELFDTHAEFDIGHIRLAREPDVVVVAPATADLMAKMAGGHAAPPSDAIASSVRHRAGG